MFGDGLLARRVVCDGLGGEIELDANEGEELIKGDKSHLRGKLRPMGTREPYIGQLISKAETIVQVASLINFGHILWGQFGEIGQLFWRILHG